MLVQVLWNEDRCGQESSHSVSAVIPSFLSTWCIMMRNVEISIRVDVIPANIWFSKPGRFVQGHGDATRRGGGGGLGLAVTVKRTVSVKSIIYIQYP